MSRRMLGMSHFGPKKKLDGKYQFGSKIVDSILDYEKTFYLYLVTTKLRKLLEMLPYLGSHILHITNTKNGSSVMEWSFS